MTLKAIARFVLQHAAIITVILPVITGVLVWVALNPARDQTTDFLNYLLREVATVPGSPCIVIPRDGHYVSGDAKPGATLTIHWLGLEKLRPDCQAPLVYGYVIANNTSVYAVPTSLGTRGVDLTVGVHDLRYRFTLPPDIPCGIAYFWVQLVYPEAEDGAPTATTPRVLFFIRNADGQDCIITDPRLQNLYQTPIYWLQKGTL